MAAEVGDDHYRRLAELLDVERREEVARIAAARKSLSDAEREARGESVGRLEVVDEEGGLAGRWLVTLAKASKEPLPPGALDVGDPVALAAAEQPDGERSPQGIVARRRFDRVTVAFDDELPEWVEGTRLRLDRLADDTTYKKLRAALDRVRAARKGERLAALRDLFDGRTEHSLSPHATLPVNPNKNRPTAQAAGKAAPEPDRGGAAAGPGGLNAPQAEAVAFALDAPDVALIHGPPGTGKTTAVIALIAAAVARGEKVLACAASNAATDLIAERCEERGLDPVRIGHPARISEAIIASSLDERARAHDDAKLARDLLARSAEIRRKLGKRTRAAPDWEEKRALREEAKVLRDDARRLARSAIDRVLDAAPVVCATLTGAEGEPLRDRTFDLVVIDEAAQALEPACWIAIARARPEGGGRRAGRVVLAGDHKQLPPTVTSPEAARRGLARTLFERLHARLGEQVARMLTTQYRMHEAIQAFPNARFYEGRLEAAPANRRHLLAELDGAELTEPWTSDPLVLFDTSGAGFDEEKQAEGSIRNPREADLAARVVREVLQAGVPPRAVGVISPYAAQVAALRERLADEVAAGLEIGTADGFQGREREAIVISLARSNTDGEIGFLSDHRRANVALTRARRGLFVIGDGSTLGGDPFYAALLEHCEKAGALRSAWELM